MLTIKRIVLACITVFILGLSCHETDVMPTLASNGVYCGEIAKLSCAEFADRYIPKRAAGPTVQAADFLKGRSHSEAIEAAMASVGKAGTPVKLVLDGQNWIIDRAVLLPSNMELVVDGCMLKLADGVFDNIIRVAGIHPWSAPVCCTSCYESISVKRARKLLVLW